MGKIVRKNLMVDADAVRDLAARRGTTESEAVRDAVEMARAAEDMVSALRGLHAIGAFADFEKRIGRETAEPRDDTVAL